MLAILKACDAEAIAGLCVPDEPTFCGKCSFYNMKMNADEKTKDTCTFCHRVIDINVSKHIIFLVFQIRNIDFVLNKSCSSAWFMNKLRLTEVEKEEKSQMSA